MFWRIFILFQLLRANRNFGLLTGVTIQECWRFIYSPPGTSWPIRGWTFTLQTDSGDRTSLSFSIKIPD